MTSRDVYVLHAELLAVVGGGRAREGQQQHVDNGSVGLTCSGGDPRLVVVPNLIRVDGRKEKAGLEASWMKWKRFLLHFFGGGVADESELRAMTYFVSLCCRL